jgi:hypothetical protein
MASSVFLRPSLALAKRPLFPFQLGTSTQHLSPTTRPPLTRSLSLSLSLVQTYTHAYTKIARRSSTNFAYVPGGRTSVPIFPLFAVLMTMIMMTFGPCIAIYKGTVNEPTTFPPANRSHGSHHWTFERLLAAGLVPLTGAAFVTSGSSAPLLDGLLGLSLIVHSHIGVRFLTTPPHFVFLSSLIPPGEFSLTAFWWITFISASSLSSVPCSLGRYA